MNLHEELAAPTPCKVCAYLVGLSPLERSEWVGELALPSGVIGHVTVVQALQRRGLTIDESSVRRHRKNHG